MMHEAGIDPSTVTTHWSPFYALDPQLIMTRVHSILQPPSTVQFQVDGNTLAATGSASIEWIKEARRLAALVPGIRLYRDEGLVSVSIPDLLTRVNRAVIQFGPGSVSIEPSERLKLHAVASALRDLGEAVSQSDQRVKLDILGWADQTGSVALNLNLSRQRAEAVLTALGGEYPGILLTLKTGSGAERTVTFLASIEVHAKEPSTARP
jgi:OOP family OmpA-OmpF porin